MQDQKVVARYLVNLEVKTRRIPRPNDLPCADCGHIWRPGERRHEYDHHAGYDDDHRYDVQAVCTICHSKRSFRRGELTPEALRAGGQARSAKRMTHCTKGHPMTRMNDGKWRCHECRLEYWRRRRG